jgi:hypothetical protein
LQPLAGGQRLLRQRRRAVVGERFVAEHLLLGVGQRACS